MKKISSGVSIGLVNPKFPCNVGAAIRGASCFGAKNVYFTGYRIMRRLIGNYDPIKKKKFDDGKIKIPREERMKGYRDVQWKRDDRFFEQFDLSKVTPVAVEFSPNSEMLPYFVHPENALYVFGPEDGGLDKGTLEQCHRFVKIPTAQCLNLAVAVNIILYDRMFKEMSMGIVNPYETDISDVFDPEAGEELVTMGYQEIIKKL